jgi:hypothetical protein
LVREGAWVGCERIKGFAPRFAVVAACAPGELEAVIELPHIGGDNRFCAGVNGP